MPRKPKPETEPGPLDNMGLPKWDEDFDGPNPQAFVPEENPDPMGSMAHGMSEDIFLEEY